MAGLLPDRGYHVHVARGANRGLGGLFRVLRS